MVAPIIHISGVPFVTQFTTGIISLIVLCVLTMAAYYTYYIFMTYGSIRTFSIGHSEDLGSFMEYQVKKMHENLLILGDSKTISTFFYNQESDYKPNNYPEIYIMFMFHHALQTGNTNELSALLDFFLASKVSRYYISGSKTTIGDFSYLSDTLKIFDEYREYVSQAINVHRDNTQSRIALLEMNLFLNYYFDDIVLGYDLRKSGRINSFSIFKVYMRDYTTFVFKETIPETWKNFSEKVKSTADYMIGYLSTDSVADYVRKLPFIISGVQESFANRIEYFGLGDFFRSIIQLAESLIQIALALMSAITNPIAFLRILMGMLVGVCMYILYVVLIALSPVFIVPAFVFEGSICTLVTIVWTAIYRCIAIVYLFLWIADIVTNGFVFSLLRCENLPNAWHTRSGFAYKNAYTRKVFCCSPCGERYDPKQFMCKNIPSYQPSFCPQQIIYSLYLKTKVGQAIVDNSTNRDFVPAIGYYAIHPVEKRMMLGQIYDDKKEFVIKCEKAMAPFKPLLREICLSTENHAILHFCRTAFCYQGCADSFCRTNESPSLPISEQVNLRINVTLATISAIVLFIFLKCLYSEL